MKPNRVLYGCVLASAVMALSSVVQNLQAADPPEPIPRPPVVHVVATDPFAAEEGADSARFQISRVGPTNQALVVLFRLGGTATYDLDYHLLLPTGTPPELVTNSPAPIYSVWMAPGQTAVPLSVAPIDDYEIEGWESVVIALEQPAVWPPPYLVEWPSVAPAWIEDNDPAPTNAPPNVAIINPPDGSVFSGVESICLAARASDVDDRVRTVEFFDGTTSLGIVTNHNWPAVTDDGSGIDPASAVASELLPEPVNGEPSPIPLNLFRLRWQNPAPGRHILSAIATDTRGASTTSEAITIVVLEHPQPVVTVKATDPEGTEPTSGSTRLDTAKFCIYRTGPTNFPLTVWYKLGGTASNGVDYAELPSMTTIPEGVRSVDILIKPLGDNLVEGDESVVLTILPPICIDTYPPPPDCYEVGSPDTAQAIIHDADMTNHPPVVRIVRPLDGSVFLAPATIPIVAQVCDLDGYWKTVEFFEGTNSLGTVTNSALPVLPMVVWSNVPPGRYVLTAVATDNDGAQGRACPVDIMVVTPPMPPVVNIFATDPAATEPSNPPMPPFDTATFTVTRTGGTLEPLTVSFRVGGTAENGVDYQYLDHHVVIPQGASSAEIEVTPLPDELVEGTESVVLTLTPLCFATYSTDPSPFYIIGTNNTAKAYIRDSTVPPTNWPPKVAIVSPWSGDTFEPDSDIPICASASDPDGLVRTVEFFANNISLGVVSNNFAWGGGAYGDPRYLSITADQIFRLVWSNAPPGTYDLLALATDNHGATGKSEVVRIKVIDIHLPPVVTIHATDPWASEGPVDVIRDPANVDPPILISNAVDTATFTVRRNGHTNVDLTVYYSITGTASNGVDYRTLPGQVTIPSGSYSANIVVAPIDDFLIEGTESVVLTLQPPICVDIYPPPPDCYTVGDPNRAVAYIADNDFNNPPKVEIVQPTDGEIFLAPAEIKINVVACDPDGWVGKVNFYAGTNLIGTREIYFIVPPPPGQAQTFSMVWSNVPPGKYVLTARAYDDGGAGTISDPVGIGVLEVIYIPVVTIEATDPIATEPDSRSASPVLDTATFTVKRVGGDLTKSLQVFYHLCGTASNGLDYVTLPGVVEIAANAATADIIVSPLDDDLVEGTETVGVALEQLRCVTTNLPPPEGCYIVGQPGRAVASIRDNDAPPNKPPTVALISPANGSLFTAPADIRLVAAAQDADGWVSTVEFFEGTNSLGIVTNLPWLVEPVRLPEFDGALLSEPSPTPSMPIPPPFVLDWPNVPPGHYVLTALATDDLGATARSAPVEITVVKSNDVPVVTIMAVDSIAEEGTTNVAVFRVRRAGATNEPLTVQYAIGGTASNGVDYALIPNHVTIPAGRHCARIVITPLEDSIAEPIEIVILRLEPSPLDVWPPPYTIGRPASAAAIILDNDSPPPAATMLLPDGHLRVRLPLAYGLPYRLEASSDLRVWETVLENVVTENGINYIEPEPNSTPQRFYRVVPELNLQQDD